jgi:hypothetical protein
MNEWIYGWMNVFKYVYACVYAFMLRMCFIDLQHIWLLLHSNTLAEKLAICKAAGADFLVNYSNLKDMKKQVEAITDGHMVDVVYDVVGGDVFDQCVRLMAGQGRLLVVGFTSGEI